MTIEILVVTPSFTKFSVGLRVVFFGLSLVSCILYCLVFSNITLLKRTLEHKLILILSVLLVLFNNPLIIVAFRGHSNFLVFLTQFSTTLLPVFLIFFWICIFERADVKIIHESQVLK